ECDDMNAVSTDACVSCRAATCGDGVVWVGVEDCDDMNASNTDGCVMCNAARCGDGFVQAGVEQCDDMNGVNTDACAMCRTAVCGDGFVQAGVEECDQGAMNSDTAPDACRRSCRSPRCGDGVVDSGESCDDGNTVNTDACSNACALAGCGDGIVQAGEECDNGAANSDTTPNACRRSCTRARCGDMVTDTGEACDDGNAVSTDACVSCVAARCGDGFVRTGVEECDDSNTANGDGCSATCLQEGCVAAAAIPCNGTVSGSLSGAMATDDFDSWECFSLSSYGGPELVYSFVPDGTGLVEVTLTGLTADADLMVMRAVSGRCAADAAAACIPSATSTRAGTADERVEFTATAGQTYFIVVDGYNGAVTNFTLRVGTAARHIQLNELSGGAPDYVELINRSACNQNLANYSLHYVPDCTPIIDWSFTASNVVSAGGVFRLIETGYTLMSNEVSTGANICDNQSSDSWAVLCHGGACDHTTTCS
ncbi:MAG: DUF4215 domain-containing protein, partial [Myxococcales bacterium]|nr:DUF4215 domain-containing protein [Myxococcales bacterium]